MMKKIIPIKTNGKCLTETTRINISNTTLCDRSVSPTRRCSWTSSIPRTPRTTHNYVAADYVDKLATKYEHTTTLWSATSNGFRALQCIISNSAQWLLSSAPFGTVTADHSDAVNRRRLMAMNSFPIAVGDCMRFRRQPNAFGTSPSAVMTQSARSFVTFKRISRTSEGELVTHQSRCHTNTIILCPSY
jgi:hypothetical protein